MKILNLIPSLLILLIVACKPYSMLLADETTGETIGKVYRIETFNNRIFGRITEDYGAIILTCDSSLVDGNQKYRFDFNAQYRREINATVKAY